jgi:hypothetical protein
MFCRACGRIELAPMPESNEWRQPEVLCELRAFCVKLKKASSRACPFGYRSDVEALLRIPCTLFPVALARQSFFGPLLLTRLQVEGMSLDLLDDVLLLDLALETPQRAFQGFSILDVDFCQTRFTCLLLQPHSHAAPGFRIAASCFPLDRKSGKRAPRR